MDAHISGPHEISRGHLTTLIVWIVLAAAFMAWVGMTSQGDGWAGWYFSPLGF